jgi:acetyl-CoA acetyltransferase family protein
MLVEDRRSRSRDTLAPAMNPLRNAVAPASGIWFLAGARTPMTPFLGDLARLTGVELGAEAARGALDRSGVEPERVDHVVIGNAQQTTADAIYGARHVGLRAGIPDSVPALTVNRLCGSGIQAVISAAHQMLAGEADTVLAGGMESMSQAPFVVRGARAGLRLGHGKLEDSLVAALTDGRCGLSMSDTAENVAERTGVTREDSDEYALRSQAAADRAYRAGSHAEEIVPVTVKTRKGANVVSEDGHRRPQTTLEGLARLRPAFRKEGLVTAGNASGIVDGGAAFVVAREDTAAVREGAPLGRIVSWATAGVPPEIMGLGPVPASRAALQAAGLRLEDMDRIEVNEAFAPQYLAVERELGLDRERVNVNGGAIALGHPLGATGTRLLLTLLLELRRSGGRYGLATACIGGGQGIAMIVEAAA